MRFTRTPLKYLFIIAGFITGFASFAINSSSIEEQANESISELYHRLNSMPNTSMAERIDWISAQFMGKTYELGALGEGPKARYDQFPRYRVDAFDCDTYVNTVLSLAMANSLSSFQQCIKFTRYENGIISYVHRNHFTSIDWNKNNQNRGVLKDITPSIKNKQHKPVAQYANALIEKANWYAHKSPSTIRLQSNTNEVQKKRLAELKAKGAILKATQSKIPYVPLTVLFLDGNTPNIYLFDQIPNGAIIEIIRPNWNLRQQIGTNLNVSHLGFAIRSKGQLYFRQASSQQSKVIDVPLIEYLKEAQKSPTIKGINIQIVLPKKPLTADCHATK